MAYNKTRREYFINFVRNYKALSKNNFIINYKSIYNVNMSLAKLVRTMHNIYKVWFRIPVITKKDINDSFHTMSLIISNLSSLKKLISPHNVIHE